MSNYYRHLINNIAKETTYSNPYNTFIGNIADSYTTKSSLATLLGIQEIDISDFITYDNNIACKIIVDYNLPNVSTAQYLSFFIDLEGRVLSLNNSFDFNSSDDSLKFTYFPNLNLVVSDAAYRNRGYLNNLKIAIPHASPIGSTTGSDLVFRNSSLNNQGAINYEVYVDEVNETINSGSPDSDLQELINYGSSVNYIRNYTIPQAGIISLNSTESTSLKINLTTSSHVNSYKYVLVFLNDYYQSIYAYASSIDVIGLKEQTDYRITLILVDEYFNISPYSNEINTTTIAIDTSILLQNSISYYKKDELSGQAIDSVDTNNGFLFGGVSQGVAGKIGNAYSYNGVDGYVDLGNPLNFKITKGSIGAWVKSSNFGSGFRRIFAKNNAYGLLLNDNVLITYDWTEGTSRTTNINIADNLWHFVVLTFESDVNNGSKIFLDGVEVLETKITISSQNDSLIIGGVDGGIQSISADIDEVFIHNQILTSQEVNKLYNNGSGTTI